MGEQKLIEKVVQQGDKKITYNVWGFTKLNFPRFPRGVKF